MSNLSYEELLAENEQLRADMAELENENEFLEREVYLAALREMSHMLANQLDLQLLLDDLLRMAAAFVRAEHAYVYLMEHNTDSLRCWAGIGIFDIYIGNITTSPHGVTGHVWRTKEIYIVEDYNTWEERHKDVPVGTFGSVIGVPLKFEDELIGVVGLAFSDLTRRFDATDIDILQTFADLSAVIVHNARVHDDLKESKQFVEKITDTIPDILNVYDHVERRTVYINNSIFHILGYAPKEIYDLGNKSNIMLAHPDDQVRGEEYSRSIWERDENAVGETEFRMRHADGEWRWLHQRDRIFQRDVKNNVLRTINIIHDITERKKIQDDLRASETRFRALMEMVDMVVYIYSREGIVYANPAVERILGYKQEAMLGEGFWNVVHPDSYAGLREQNRRFLETGIVWPRQEVKFYTEAGEIRWLDLSHTLVTLEGETVLLGTGLDITERKEAEQTVMAFNLEKERVRLLGDFVQAISHDFRTPLATINTGLYLLERTQEPERRQQRVKIIHEQVALLEKMVGGLLTMILLDSGRGLLFDHLDVGTMLQELVMDLQRTAAAKNLELTFDADQTLPPIQGDESKMRGAFEHIIENALFFTPSGGKIAVKAAFEEDCLQIDIQDNGIGIAAEEQSRIFERLYRVDKARTTVGLGLGLPIAQKVVEGHGGHIEVISAPGEGSTFRVMLPIS